MWEMPRRSEQVWPSRDRDLPMVGTQSRNRNLAQRLLKRHHPPLCQRRSICFFPQLCA
jgi:hypothetical protein